MEFLQFFPSASNMRLLLVLCCISHKETSKLLSSLIYSPKLILLSFGAWWIILNHVWNYLMYLWVQRWKHIFDFVLPNIFQNASRWTQDQAHSEEVSFRRDLELIKLFSAYLCFCERERVACIHSTGSAQGWG